MYRYFAFHKPFQVLSQFSPVAEKETLATYLKNFPRDVYPIGRLDYDSEGLLLLTNDPRINSMMLHPAHRHPRTYLVQVEGLITPTAIASLEQGVPIRINGDLCTTAPAIANALTHEPDVPPRVPPIRMRRNIPVSWISLCLTEGKNRQVRRMTAAVGFPTLRLIRTRINNILVENLPPGAFIEISYEQICGGEMGD